MVHKKEPPTAIASTTSNANADTTSLPKSEMEEIHEEVDEIYDLDDDEDYSDSGSGSGSGDGDPDYLETTTPKRSTTTTPPSSPATWSSWTPSWPTSPPTNASLIPPKVRKKWILSSAMKTTHTAYIFSVIVPERPMVM